MAGYVDQVGTVKIQCRVRRWVKPTVRVLACLHAFHLLPFPSYVVRLLSRYGIIVEVVR
jgi:hypothetical protein